MEYSIEKYNPNWTNKFQEIKTLLEIVFKDKFIYIEHVGSTSIPGLKAKPTIDVLAVMKQWDDFEVEKTLMTNEGYQFRTHTKIPNSLLFFKVSGDEKTENIHVFEIGTPKIDEFLNVRDYLRSHSEKAHEYEVLKEKLVTEYPNDYNAYKEGKGNFLKEINKLATEWRK